MHNCRLEVSKFLKEPEELRNRVYIKKNRKCPFFRPFFARFFCLKSARFSPVFFIKLSPFEELVTLKLHFSKESKGFKPKQEMDLFWTPGTF